MTMVAPSRPQQGMQKTTGSPPQQRAVPSRKRGCVVGWLVLRVGVVVVCVVVGLVVSVVVDVGVRSLVCAMIVVAVALVLVLCCLNADGNADAEAVSGDGRCRGDGRREGSFGRAGNDPLPPPVVVVQYAPVFVFIGGVRDSCVVVGGHSSLRGAWDTPDSSAGHTRSEEGVVR